MSNTLGASCEPPKQLGSIFVDARCTPSSSFSDLSVAYQSYEGVGFFLKLDDDTKDTLDGQEIGYQVSFRQPIDIDTGQALICGEDEFGENRMSTMPSIVSMAQSMSQRTL